MVVRRAARAVQDGICAKCLFRATSNSQRPAVHPSTIYTRRKIQSSAPPDRSVQRSMLVVKQSFIDGYFSANNSIEQSWLGNKALVVWRTGTEAQSQLKLEVSTAYHGSVIASGPAAFPAECVDTSATFEREGQEVSRGGSELNTTVTKENMPPHRRRKQQKEAASNMQVPAVEQQLPLDASSLLTTATASLPPTARFRRRLTTYLSLSKPRLSFLILLTTTSSYSLYPIPEILSSSAAADLPTTFSTSTLTFLFLTSGTFLSCACANTLNMLIESKYDALMTRTRNRPLVRNLISRPGAAAFALACGTTGLSLLYFGTNPTVAGLSALNIFLYAGVYTPMKRVSAANTWVGAIVGGIPPLMGWCAAAGQAATSEHHSWQDLLFSNQAVGGWLLAALLFAWQFPHFMSLSHSIRDDYRNAGHKMLAWINPARNARVALRYSLAMFPICTGLYWAGIVNQGFLAISTACNLWMTREAVRFWQKQGAGGSARGLFWASVWQLPLVLVGALVCKNRIWDWVFGEKEQSEMLYVGQEESASIQKSEDPKELNNINLGMVDLERQG
ncbi:hypothetical protein DV736_g5271, partial [Chaetothyriales sp. CBS 134916]